MEIRKKSPAGEVYPPNTLYCLCCGIQRYLREEGQADINTFTDPKFKLFRDSLDAEMKRLTSLGVGVKRKQAEAFSEDDQSLLWNSWFAINLSGCCRQWQPPTPAGSDNGTNNIFFCILPPTWPP